MEAEESVESRESRWQWPLELAVTLLLGVGAIAVAWSSYQGSLYSGASSSEYAKGIRTSDTASQQWTESFQVEMQDQSLFLEFAKAAQANDTDLATYLKQTLMRPELSAAIDWWTAQPDATQPDSPFVPENTAYVNVARDQAVALDDQAEAQFTNASTYGDKGDKFGLITTIVALALFLLGLAAVFRRIVIRGALTGGAFVVLLFAVVQLVQLGPFTSL